MRHVLAILFAIWLLCPTQAGACGLDGPWYVRSDDGYTGLFVIEKVVDAVTCEAQLSVFLPIGDSAVEAMPRSPIGQSRHPL